MKKKRATLKVRVARGLEAAEKLLADLRASRPRPHQHRRDLKAHEIEHCYSQPLAHPGNPAARGNITRLETCKCGFVRSVNVNQQWRECGPWHEPEEAPW